MSAQHKKGEHLKGSPKHSEPHVTKLEREDVDWPGQHSKERGSHKRNRKRYHPHRREGGRKHVNW